MTDRRIHLGYELGTAAPVEIPLKHMAVTGQTQLEADLAVYQPSEDDVEQTYAACMAALAGAAGVAA